VADPVNSMCVEPHSGVAFRRAIKGPFDVVPIAIDIDVVNLPTSFQKLVRVKVNGCYASMHYCELIRHSGLVGVIKSVHVSISREGCVDVLILITITIS
jgi:hypothetical protein